MPARRTAGGRALALLALALAGGTVISLAARRARGVRAAGPLMHEGYVWQRAWDAGAAEQARRAGLAGIVALAAEADLARRPPHVVEVALPAAPRPSVRLGLALRLGPLPGGFTAAPAAAAETVRLARRAVARARAAGWQPSELQIDFDCAAARLPDYARLLRRVRQAVAPLPVVPTALPSWLDRRSGFAALLAASDGFVLQVHSLELPAAPAAPLVLCDAAAAAAAVERAARYRRPFRVALPTYGYRAGFTPGGRLVGLEAEGPSMRWPAGTVVRTVRSDPAAMARLVAGWTRDRPHELTGFLWYRLPAAGDRLNWRWPTLHAVLAGRAPRPRLVATRRAAAASATPGAPPPAPPEVAEIELWNAGEAPATPPAAVRVRWEHNRLLAADGVAAYGVRTTGRGELWLVRPRQAARGGAAGGDAAPVAVAASAASAAHAADADPLEPGERQAIGWLRFDRPTEVHIDPVAAPPP